jgi:ADP-L-glycero-D-manno-heptose 6-epimerase
MKKVIVTGGAGFIGSAFVWKLNNEGLDDILIVDQLRDGEKWKNLTGLRFSDYLNKNVFWSEISNGILRFPADAIVHMGACSSTTENNADYLIENNYRFTRVLAELAVQRGIRFLYASSGATYGDGSCGFSDTTDLQRLRPLNMYGYSKHLVDLHAERSGVLSGIVGLKFFNVFGPNEYHKADMVSMVHKAFRQILATGSVMLYKSNHPNYRDGEQMRDFVYVKDCVKVMWWLLTQPTVNGLFNLGSGTPRSWNDLVGAVFRAMGLLPNIRYVEMHDTLRNKYQNYTQAVMDKLDGTGCPRIFMPLEDSVRDYVLNHLQAPTPYLSIPPPIPVPGGGMALFLADHQARSHEVIIQKRFNRLKRNSPNASLPGPRQPGVEHVVALRPQQPCQLSGVPDFFVFIQSKQAADVQDVIVGTGEPAEITDIGAMEIDFITGGLRLAARLPDGLGCKIDTGYFPAVTREC